MKKSILLILAIFSIYMALGEIISSSNVIPEEAIRIRVVANSNSEYDQKMKNKVKYSLEKDMYNLLKNTSTVEEAREIIRENLNNVKNNVDNVLHNEKYNMPFNINFGLNYFPSKEFKGIVYEEGYYESLVVTLGEGLGDNWWCVLFPPLCLIEAEEHTDVEYTTIIKKILDKYFKK